MTTSSRPSNLNRQRFYIKDVGKNKALALAENLQPECIAATEIRGIPFRLEEAIARGIDLACDVAICGVDNNPARVAASRYFRANGIPVIFTAVSRDGDHGYVFVQDKDGPVHRLPVPGHGQRRPLSVSGHAGHRRHPAGGRRAGGLRRRHAAHGAPADLELPADQPVGRHRSTAPSLIPRRAKTVGPRLCMQTLTQIQDRIPATARTSGDLRSSRSGRQHRARSACCTRLSSRRKAG